MYSASGSYLYTVVPSEYNTVAEHNIIYIMRSVPMVKMKMLTQLYSLYIGGT